MSQDVYKRQLRGLVKIEDGWYGNVSPTGATGVGQFTRGTWNWLATTDEGRALGMTQITRYNLSLIHIYTNYFEVRSTYIKCTWECAYCSRLENSIWQIT